MKIEEVVIKFEETVIKTSQRMTAIEAHFPDLKFSVMKIEVFSEGLYFICSFRGYGQISDQKKSLTPNGSSLI